MEGPVHIASKRSYQSCLLLLGKGRGEELERALRAEGREGALQANCQQYKLHSN